MRYFSCFYIFFITLILTSCSTLLSTEMARVDVYGINDSTRIEIVELDTSINGDFSLLIPRQKGEYSLNVFHGKDSFNYKLKSRLSNDFLIGNYFFAPYSYAIDLLSNKYRAYNKILNFSLNPNDSISHNSWDYGKKGTSGVRFCLGQGNTFNFSNSEFIAKTNFRQFSFGVEAYITDDVSINIDAISLSDYLFLSEGTRLGLIRLQSGFEMDRFKLDIGGFIGFNRYENFEQSAYLYSFSRIGGSVISPSFRITSGVQIGLSYYHTFLEFIDNRVFENTISILTVDLIFRRTILRKAINESILKFPKKNRGKIFKF